jgi:hypothetical protein
VTGMIKKELKEIIFPALTRLSIILIPAPLLLIVGAETSHVIDILKMTAATLAVSILWVANNYGNHVFKSEYQDHAFEYLLSFPLSKAKIIYNKLVPRTAILSGLAVFYECSLLLLWLNDVPLSRGFLAFPLNPVFFPLWVIFFLFTGFCLGLVEQRNLRALANFLIFLCYIFISLGAFPALRYLDIFQGEFRFAACFAIGALTIIAIMGTAFISVFKTFDLRMVKSYGKKILFRTLPLILLLTVIGVVILTKANVFGGSE